MAGQGHERVSRGFAVNRADHVHPEGETGPQEGQQGVLQQTKQITYPLRAGRATRGSAVGFAANKADHVPTEGRTGHERVSSGFCSKQSRSRTP
jgi:hypothetical protein